MSWRVLFVCLCLCFTFALVFFVWVDFYSFFSSLWWLKSGLQNRLRTVVLGQTPCEWPLCLSSLLDCREELMMGRLEQENPLSHGSTLVIYIVQKTPWKSLVGSNLVVLLQAKFLLGIWVSNSCCAAVFQLHFTPSKTLLKSVERFLMSNTMRLESRHPMYYFQPWFTQPAEEKVEERPHSSPQLPHPKGMCSGWNWCLLSGDQWQNLRAWPEAEPGQV